MGSAIRLYINVKYFVFPFLGLMGIFCHALVIEIRSSVVLSLICPMSIPLTY